MMTMKKGIGKGARQDLGVASRRGRRERTTTIVRAPDNLLSTEPDLDGHLGRSISECWPARPLALHGLPACRCGF